MRIGSLKSAQIFKLSRIEPGFGSCNAPDTSHVLGEIQSVHRHIKETIRGSCLCKKCVNRVLILQFGLHDWW